MTLKNEEPWVFHRRFFDDLNDFLEMFETCFDNNPESAFSPIEKFDYSGRDEVVLLGSFYDNVEDRPALIHFTFSRFESVNGSPRKGITARAEILEQEVLLYGWSDDHDMYTFFPCESITGKNVSTTLFGE